MWKLWLAKLVRTMNETTKLIIWELQFLVLMFGIGALMAKYGTKTDASMIEGGITMVLLYSMGWVLLSKIKFNKYWATKKDEDKIYQE